MENWFIVKLVYQIICGEGRHRPQFEEQWRLVYAVDCTDAVSKAESMALKEATFNPGDRLPVQWRFLFVADLLPLNEMTNGAEILAITREPYDQQVYLQSAKFSKEGANRAFHFLQV